MDLNEFKKNYDLNEIIQNYTENKYHKKLEEKFYSCNGTEKIEFVEEISDYIKTEYKLNEENKTIFKEVFNLTDYLAKQNQTKNLISSAIASVISNTGLNIGNKDIRETIESLLENKK